MKKVLSTFFLFLLLCTTAFSQWNYLGPWPDANYKGGTHGIVVSPDGKIWTSSYYKTPWYTPNGDTILTSPIIVFNADGSVLDTIHTVTSGSVTDTLGLGGSTSGCRGMAKDADGNILYVSGGPSKLIKINYQTLEGMGSRLIPETGSSPTAPSVSSDGTIYIGPVVGGNGKAIATYSSTDLSYLGNAVLNPPDIARTMEVSPDGLTIYWTTFTGKQGIWVYSRPDDLSEFELTDSLFQGMSIESSAWQPGTGLLWISNDLRGLDKNFTHLTWYGVDPVTKQIVNSFTLPQPNPTNSDEYPRGLDFSPDGQFAYVGLFGTVFDRIYRFEAVPLTEYNVTFQVDMGVQAFEGTFDPVNGKVVIRGDFQNEAGDAGGDWQGDFFELSDPDGDTVYTKTVTFPLSEAGKSFNFKYVIQPNNNWESTPNRTFSLNLPNQTLTKVWFNDDNVYTVVSEVTNTLEFTADISNILGVGVGGAFDSNQDSILVMGLDWDNFGKDVTGNRRLFNTDPFNNGIYTTTLTVTSGSAAPNGVGDSTKWKFRAFPETRFANTGWETGSDRWHYYVADGQTVTLDPIVPRIYPLFGPLTVDVPVQFNVDLTGAINAKNGEPIPVDQVEWVGIKGAAPFLGSWGGSWTVADTLGGDASTLKVLHKVSGNLWRYDVVVPAGTNSGAYEYKYAAYYPGADTVSGGSTPLDNEGGFGVNHLLLLTDKPSGIVLNNQFGNFTTGIEKLDDVIPAAYQLDQNYPNPFNPSTTIRYSIPEAGLVTVKVFNLLGQEVATLVNTQQATGAYEVTFDASQLSSGIYFYSIEVNNFTATKKMILMK